MRKWLRYTDVRNRNAWRDITNLYPTAAGSYRTGPGLATTGTAAAGPATPGTTLVAWAGIIAGGSAVGYVGTSTKCYLISNLSTGSFTDVSSGAYSSAVARFAQFGNITIKCDGTNNTESRDASGGGNFAALAGAPKAKYVVVAKNAVLLLNVNDGTAKPDGFYASDVGDYTNWSTGEAANRQIIERSGAITAAVNLRDDVIVFKETSMFRLRYVGGSVKWASEFIADMGVSSAGRVAVCGDFLVMVGRGGAFVFDGTSFRDIGTGFESDGECALGSLFTSTIRGQEAIWYPGSGHVVFPHDMNTGNGDGRTLVYNVRSDAWGKITGAGSNDYASALMTGTARAIGLVAGLTKQAVFGPHSATAGTALNYINLSNNPCVKDDHGSLDQTWDATTEIYGDESQVTNVNRLQPVWYQAGNITNRTPTTTATAYTATVYGGASIYSQSQVGGTITSSTATQRFDFTNSSKFVYAIFGGAKDAEFTDAIWMCNDTVPKRAGTN